MTTFRAKPHTVEAVQVIQGEWLACGPSWLPAAISAGDIRPDVAAGDGWLVKTQTGATHARYGDWIAKGPTGALHVYRPEIFAKMYMRVEPLPATAPPMDLATVVADLERGFDPVEGCKTARAQTGEPYITFKVGGDTPEQAIAGWALAVNGGYAIGRRGRLYWRARPEVEELTGADGKAGGYAVFGRLVISDRSAVVGPCKCPVGSECAAHTANNARQQASAA